MSEPDEDFIIPSQVFEEPEGFRPPPPPPSFHTFKRLSDDAVPPTLSIRLVGQHSLWAHCLWNAGVALARKFDADPSLVKGKNVLELGAAASLPSMICALNGAKKVVITDYPDSELIRNICYNVHSNLLPLVAKSVVDIKGFLWGQDPHPLLQCLSISQPLRPLPLFDIIILSDLIFNHSQHSALLKTCIECLNPDSGVIYCAFSHHRPWMQNKDLAFFQLAQSPPFHFIVKYVGKETMPPMFENDPGDVDIRSTIHFYELSFH